MSFHQRVQNDNETFKYQIMVSHSRKNIELIVKTLLNEEKIHTETAKSILENLNGYEGEINEVLTRGVALFLERGFNYTIHTAANMADLNIDNLHKEDCVGETETEKYKYSFNIIRRPKR
jgi:hypothetical protein